MNNQKTPAILLGSLLLLWGLNELAGYFDLYFMFSWYDIFMHTFGGIILGLIVVVCIRNITWLRNLTTIQKFYFIVAVACIGGLFWEVFEYVQDIYLHTQYQLSWSDTLSDILCDIIGGGIVGGIYWYRRKL